MLLMLGLLRRTSVPQFRDEIEVDNLRSTKRKQHFGGIEEVYVIIKEAQAH